MTSPTSPLIHESVSIHESSIIDAGVSLGADTKIWHWVHVCKGAKIGKGCVLGQNVYIGPGVIIGNNVKIQNNVSVYQGVEIQDDVFCGPSMVFTNVSNPRSAVNRKDEFKPTLVKRGVSIGANATIVCGVTLEEYCFVAAGAVVTKDAPAYGMMMGVPAIQKAWMDRRGNKLPFVRGQITGEFRCEETGNSYILRNGAVHFGT